METLLEPISHKTRKYIINSSSLELTAFCDVITDIYISNQTQVTLNFGGIKIPLNPDSSKHISVYIPLLLLPYTQLSLEFEGDFMNQKIQLHGESLSQSDFKNMISKYNPYQIKSNI